MASESLDIEDVNDNGEIFVEQIDDFIEESEQKPEFEVIDNIATKESMATNKKISIPYLTKYERAKIIGYRATQISRGAEPFIDPYKYGITDTIEIARKELELKQMPLIIRRKMPSGKYEDWKIEEFIN